MTAIGQTIRSVFLALLMGAWLSLANAGTDGPARLDRFFENVNTFKASFMQEVLDENLLTIEETRGVLWIARPGRFRWDYMFPSKF